MTDDDRLHDALSGLVPTPPLAPERAAAARSYASRARRGRIAAGTGVVLVAAAIVVPLALAGGSDRADNAPRPATSPSPGVVAGDFDCPPPSEHRYLIPPLEGPGLLPDDPIAVRFCFPGGDIHWQPPMDALIQAARTVQEAVNDLPTLDNNGFCAGVGAPTWGLDFQYADGHTQLITGDLGGCDGVTVGPSHRGRREDARNVLELVQQLLWSQRSEQSPPPLGFRQPACDHTSYTSYTDGPGFTMMTWQRPLQLSRGALCWQYATHSVQPLNSAPLSPDDLAVLVADFNEHASDGNSPNQGCTQVITVALDGINAWGDELRMDSSCGTFFGYDGEQVRWWRPDQRSQAILDRVISTSPLQIPLPSADAAPDEVVNAWVDLFNNDRPERAGPLWVGDQPTLTGVDRIELKIYGIDTVVPGSTTPEASYQQVRVVTANYREVPLDADFGDRAFTLVRNSSDEPWRILSYDDPGAAQPGR